MLYGILPPLAALALRRIARAAAPSATAATAAPETRATDAAAVARMPGGRPALVAVAALACSLLGINARLWLF